MTPQCFQCEMCGFPAGIDHLKRLVIRAKSPFDEDYKFMGRYLCPLCYEEFLYFMTEDWDAQSPGAAEEGGLNSITDSGTGAPLRGEGPSKLSDADYGNPKPFASSERGQPSDGAPAPSAPSLSPAGGGKDRVITIRSKYWYDTEPCDEGGEWK